MENNQLPREISLCLSGGAAKGAFHLGVISVLQEKNIVIKAISGTSIGALIGASIANGKRAEEIFEIFASKEFKKVFKLSLSQGCLFKIDMQSSVIKKLVDCEHFSELEIPLHVAILNLEKQEIEYHSHGDNLKNIILASCSISPMIRPTRIDETLYMDGGVLDNFPVKPLKRYKYKILGVNLYPKVDLIPNSFLGWVKRVVYLAWQSPNYHKAKECDVYLTHPKLQQMTTFSFKDIKKAYALGGETALEFLETKH